MTSPQAIWPMLTRRDQKLIVWLLGIKRSSHVKLITSIESSHDIETYDNGWAYWIENVSSIFSINNRILAIIISAHVYWVYLYNVYRGWFKDSNSVFIKTHTSNVSRKTGWNWIAFRVTGNQFNNLNLKILVT